MCKNEEGASSGSSSSTWRLWVPGKMVKKTLISRNTPGLLSTFLSPICLYASTAKSFLRSEVKLYPDFTLEDPCPKSLTLRLNVSAWECAH